ncbi:hypothetical protein [Aporhodopirellula aestuarii]|uniref:Uncharacterized protein n=1 Tax=Aporhodopirellula aestuarii TaxID=2950107 RepID=A0ABT0U401_9BACT|nr:hypothetical protein [Aporhodopirellula aestuarii]MCM2371647.1 hypothetical protein [Aporhodopirellula aestuarii]
MSAQYPGSYSQRDLAATNQASQYSHSGTSGWNGNPGLRPVPKVRSSAMYPSTINNAASASTPAQRPGWNLQWRTSPQIAAEQAREISDAAFEQPATQSHTARIVATAADHARVESRGAMAEVQPNQLRQQPSADLQRVAWMQQSESASGGFSLPGNAFRDSTATPPSDTEMIHPGPSFRVPEPNNFQELPAPSQPQQMAPPATPEPNFGGPSNDLERLFEGGPSADPSPSQQPSPNDPSIRDMLQNEPEELPEPPSKSLQPIDPSDMQDEFEDSPSDRDTFAPNPFGRSNDEREMDRYDDGGRDDRDFASPLFAPEQDGPTNSGTGLSCEDFRKRIRAATIDQVSLDPSPPFRPDVIDYDEFEKLKGKFDTKQKSRTWRSIEGRSLGTGRLDDLAYEKAVIVTDRGTREEIPLNRLSEPDLAYISQNWGLPTECLIEQVAYTPRQWTPTTMTYTASNLCHKPLYFEEVNLERYGHTAGPLAQPIISSAHFFLNIAVLPYKMGVHSPHECQYALGYYRPGNCAPWIIPPVPLSVKGAWYQAAAVTGTALLVP